MNPAKQTIVTNSTCLIGLEKIGGLDVLSELFDPVLMTPYMQQEFGISVPWLHIQVPTDMGMVATLRMLVDEAESASIALAYELGCAIILDDRRSRSVARNLGLTIIGTIGILVKAKTTGLIFSLQPILDELQHQGFFLDPALRAQALKITSELPNAQTASV
ncbi:MAG: DUF3368 domain-containing protein [Chloroflexaceae bacterium]|nr:DUF3368 domain-containing protein [Chloroflexaceae bacterium]